MKFIKKKIIKNKDGLFFVTDKAEKHEVSEDYEKDLRDSFFLKSNECFIDIGSHIGKYTIMIGNKYLANLKGVFK